MQNNSNKTVRNPSHHVAELLMQNSIRHCTRMSNFLFCIPILIVVGDFNNITVLSYDISLNAPGAIRSDMLVNTKLF